MIAGLSTKAAAYLLVAATLCPAHNPPTVTVSLVEKQPAFVNSSSTTELTRERVDTVFARRADEVFTTGGITNGKTSASFKVGFRKLIQPQSGEGCLWSDKVEVTVLYEPTVHIAREYKPGTCRYTSIADHEMRHVSTDVITLRQYIPALRAAVEKQASVFGTQFVPHESQMKQRQSDMSDRLQDAITNVMEGFEKLRAQRQQQIDTRAEYLRLSNMCR